MDYSNICQGWIYTITNKVNGKIYVGKTNNFERRRKEHFYRKDESCTILKRAMEKYGRENFEMKPLLTFIAVNNNVLTKVMNWLEVYYIKKFNTQTDGYNITSGGEGNHDWHPSEETKEKIRNSTKGRQCSDFCKIRNREVMLKRELWKINERAVLQYDLNGRFFRKYSSISDAVSYLIESGLTITTNRGTVRDSLSTVLNKRKNNTAYGFIWVFENKDDFQLFIDVPKVKHSKDKPLYYYTKEGELIASFDNVREAEKATGINRKAINMSAYASRLSTIKIKNYWSRIGPTA